MRMNLKLTYLLALIFLTLVSNAQDTTQHLATFVPFRPMQDAVMEGNPVKTEALYYQIYSKVDTSTKEKKKAFVADTYIMATALWDQKKYDSAMDYLVLAMKYPEFDNEDCILGEITYMEAGGKNKRFMKIRKAAYDRLLKKSAKYQQKELRVILLAMKVTDQSNMVLAPDSIFQADVSKMLEDSVGRMLERNGYPDLKKVGKDAAAVPTQILLHATPETQKKYKELIYNAGMAGKIPSGFAGVLLDKIQVREKGTQLFGTQYELIGPDHKVWFYPIEDSAHFAERREKIGFDYPYEEYTDLIYQHHGK